MSLALLAALELEAGPSPDVRVRVRPRVVQVERGRASIRTVVAAAAPDREAL